MQYTVGAQYGVRYTVGTQYAVFTQYAVGVSAKWSTHTVDLANMVVGTVTFSAIRSNPHSGVRSRYTVCNRKTVCSRCQCKKVNSHS